MGKLVANCLVVAALAALAVPVQAQTDLTDSRTAEQKWTRMIYMSNFIFSGLLAYGEEMGKSPEEIGVWFGDFASRSWGGLVLILFPPLSDRTSSTTISGRDSSLRFSQRRRGRSDSGRINRGRRSLGRMV